MFWGSVKDTGYQLHSPVSPSLPFPCITMCHHISTRVYYMKALKSGNKHGTREWALNGLPEMFHFTSPAPYWDWYLLVMPRRNSVQEISSCWVQEGHYSRLHPTESLSVSAACLQVAVILRAHTDRRQSYSYHKATCDADVTTRKIPLQHEWQVSMVQKIIWHFNREQIYTDGGGDGPIKFNKTMFVL